MSNPGESPPYAQYAPPPLMHMMGEWAELLTEEGYVYYYNQFTNETQVRLQFRAALPPPCPNRPATAVPMQCCRGTAAC